MEFIHGAVDWMLSWAGSPYAVVALFIFSFWESSFFPLPPDPLLIAMAVADPAKAPYYALVCTVASVLGAALGYFIGKKGGRPVVYRIFKEKRVESVEKLYKRYDAWAVGAAAFTPIPYKVFTITAGIAEINFWRFLLVSFLGRGARFFLVGMAVFFFGPSIQIALDQYFEVVTVSFLLLLVLGFVAAKFLGDYLTKREAGREGESGISG
ncbi:YqaA family protein [Rubrobacter indicoceani]|uniref:YqaA family protein n=1 Tax=Rubrobacter indicoceani TaxID=2051957 RepID=UPI001968B342|nr:YqaA family protein [Rubrobacter indicoceani]